MDKQKVIEAYRRGMITLQECGQILGTDLSQVEDLVLAYSHRRSANSRAIAIGDNA